MLNIQTEHLENHTARLTVEVDEPRLERAMARAAREIAKKGRIPGFRPGKAPMSVVINLYGRDYVLSEALDSLGNEIYREALEQAEIDPYAPGSLENVEQEGRTLTFVVPLRPTVDLGDYRAIRASHEAEDVSEQMVSDALENLREEQAELDPVDRPAEMGDRITFDHIEIVLVSDEEEDEAEGAAGDDDTAEVQPAEEDIDEENHAADVEQTDHDDELAGAQAAAAADDYDASEGPGTGEASGALDDEDDVDENDEGDVDDLYDEDDEDDDIEVPPGRVILHQHGWDRVVRDDEHDLFPGFSAHLVGLSAGDHTTFTLDIPQDFETSELQGRQIWVDAHVDQVRSRVLPDWSDALAAQISGGEQETIDALRVKMREQLEEASRNLAYEATLEDALDQLVNGATFAYPEELLQDYLSDLMAEFDRAMRQQGLTLQDYMRITGQSTEQIREQYRPRAIERAERALALGQLVAEEELNVSDEEIEAEIDAMSAALGGGQTDRFRQFLMSDQSRLNIANRLATSRASGRLLAIARGENPPKGPDPKDDTLETPPQVAAVEAPQAVPATKGELESGAREDQPAAADDPAQADAAEQAASSGAAPAPQPDDTAGHDPAVE